MLRTDTRAQAHGFILFLAIIVGSALFFIIADPAMGSIAEMSLSQTDNQEAIDVIEERQQIWGYILFFCMFLGTIMLIARSVRQSRRP